MSSENKVITSWLVIRRVKEAKNCPHCDRQLIGPEDAMARFHSIEAAQKFVERELMEGAPANKMKMVPIRKTSEANADGAAGNRP